MSSLKKLIVGLAVSCLFTVLVPAGSLDPVVIKRQGQYCADDPNCFNRFHPDIPMKVKAQPGQLIVMDVRNAGDLELDSTGDWKQKDPPGSTVHPITGPVYIEGAKAGDVIAVTLVDASPGLYGYTVAGKGGFLGDLFPEGPRVYWTQDQNYAVSKDLPGIRIPNGTFPGIVTTLPSHSQLGKIRDREAALAALEGDVALPLPDNAVPGSLCGPEGAKKDECVRTFPPREHGGNMDIRYLKSGVTVYLPCNVDGCGLGVGDPHYAQGDGEVSVTAIETDATFVLRTEIIRGMKLPRGPHFEGPATLLDIPSTRFYATTGFPLKEAGSVPFDMNYLGANERIAPLENLSNDIALSARNALLEMIDYMVATKGLTREQAYLVASVAVDLRIGQLVDAPNVGVTAILPLDIFQ
jgi:formamidase